MGITAPVKSTSRSWYEERNPTTAFRLPRSEADRLRTLAVGLGVKPSELIRGLVRTALAAPAQPNPREHRHVILVTGSRLVSCPSCKAVFRVLEPAAHE